METIARYLPVGADPMMFILVGSLATALMSMAKAGFGGSMALLATPMMIYACARDGLAAAGIILPLLMVCDLISVYFWWRQWNWRAVWMILPGGAVGILIGWVVLHWLNQMNDKGQKDLANAWLMTGIGVFCLWFVALQIYKARRGEGTPFRPVFWQGSFVGTAAGITSMIGHSAGPITQMYMVSQQLPKGMFVASTVLYYWIGNALKFGPYMIEGQVNPNTLIASLALVPAVVVGTVLGVYLHRRVGPRQFTVLVYVLLSLAGVGLVIDGLRVFMRP
ncbi:MAG: sulfite exporter TauE/SafE family protein [Planctomycetaceae bacterium]|nr:sulfite exporter TauE/SafE family protein [Planctomycetaceae bacterium]